MTGSLNPLPLPSGSLERHRLRLRQWNRGQLPGSHLVRRKGQSLEFRELRPYLPGDDIRYVDWRVSARHAGPHELIERAFELEAQTRIVISIDGRESMRLPSTGSKLQVAVWLAEALAFIAGRSGDHISIHNLFDASPTASLTDLGSRAGRARIRSVLRRFAKAPRIDEPLCLRPLDRALPPASIWFVVTDLYLEAREIETLASRVRKAQDGLRWVILADLDSWPRECALLGDGLRLVEGPGPPRPQPRVAVTDRTLQEVEGRIAARKARFEKAARAGGYDRMHWQWPRDGRHSLLEFFRERFFADPILRRILMKDE